MSINACNCHSPALDALTIAQTGKKAHAQKSEAVAADLATNDPAALGAKPQPPAPAPSNNLMQHVMVDWGMTNSPYDLDGSGLVDVNDLLLALQTNGTTASTTPTPTAGGPSSAGNANTLAHVMIDFGQANSPYDLNGDGTVDVSDVLFSITNWSSGGGNQAADVANASPTTATSEIAADVEAAGVGATDAAKAGAAALDADALAQSPVAAAITTPPPAASDVATTARAKREEIAALRSERKLAPGQLRKLGAELMEKLYAAGFQKHPPSNILDVVEKLNLNADNRKELMAQIHQHFPKGLGVNLHA